MAFRQNTTVTSSKLLVGNCKVETSATANGTYVNLGIGRTSGLTYNVEKYTCQSGNGPDPLEGIAKETVTADIELMEYDASVLSAIQCGAVTSDTSTSSTISTLNAGGNTVLTPRAFKFTQTSMAAGATKQTIITVYYATIGGFSFAFKDDQDADPIGVMTFAMEGECDTARTVGSQLFKIVKDI